MSNIFKKLFPTSSTTSFSSSFKILILSEGYTQAMEGQFYKDVANLWFNIGKYNPFSTDSKSLSIYSLFKSSNQQGYASSQAQATGRTAFESYYDTSAQNLSINNTIIDAFLDDSIIQEDGIQINVNKYLCKDVFQPSVSNTLVLILLPTSNINTAEAEIVSSSNYYKIATSCDGNYEQVIIRAIARLIGLGDEYELGGSQYEVPTSDIGESYSSYYPNIVYLNSSTNSPNPTSTVDFKWRTLFPGTFNQQLMVHAHPGSVATPDRTLPTQNLNYDKIELWEGAAGYRTQLYRPSFDCLQRRKIGDSTLPVKQKKIDLCPICSIVLSGIFGR